MNITYFAEMERGAIEEWLKENDYSEEDKVTGDGHDSNIETIKQNDKS